MHVLLDEQDRLSAPGDGPQGGEQLLGQARAETERGLVEQQELRIAHQGPRDREHLLLAPAQGARELPGYRVPSTAKRQPSRWLTMRPAVG